MAYDPADGVTILFGGCPNGLELYYTHTCTAVADTWIFAAGIWTNITSSLSSSSPPARADAGIAYDSADGYVVLFGGFDGNTLYQDTWTFVGGVWSEVHPAPSPQARFSPGMAYDGADHEVVLFGGADNSGSNSFNDTWTYRAGSWSQASSTFSPAPRFSMGMTYDVANHIVLLFGGWSAVETGSFGDTWSFSGGQWTELTPTTVPSPRNYLAMTYDAALNATVMTGGHVGASVYNDTWTYNFTDGWHVISGISAPPPRWGQDLTYDPASEVVWQFGGFTDPSTNFNDTWAFGSPLRLTPQAEPGVGVAGLLVHFVARAIGGLPPYSYRWTFGDSSPDSLVDNATHVYGAAGNYTANVSVSTALTGTASASIRILVVSPLMISVAQNRTTIPLGQEVTFSTDARAGLPPYTYTWTSLPTGCTDANQSVLPCTPTGAGTFSPVVTVTDNAAERVTGNFSLQVTGSSSNGFLGGISTGWLIILIVVAAVVVVAIVLAVGRALRSARSKRPPPE